MLGTCALRRFRPVSCRSCPPQSHSSTDLHRPHRPSSRAVDERRPCRAQTFGGRDRGRSLAGTLCCVTDASGVLTEPAAVPRPREGRVGTTVRPGRSSRCSFRTSSVLRPGDKRTGGQVGGTDHRSPTRSLLRAIRPRAWVRFHDPALGPQQSDSSSSGFRAGAHCRLVPFRIVMSSSFPDLVRAASLCGVGE